MTNNDLKTLLHKLESLWAQQNAPILNKLAPGIKLENHKLANFEGTLPPDVYTLYEWRNGVNATSKDLIGQLEMFEFGIFISLEKAAGIQKQNVGHKLGWDNKKLVLFESGGGESYLVEGDRSKKSYGMIIYNSVKDLDFDLTITKYDSLYSLFSTIYECFLSGVFSYQNSFLEIDDAKSFEIGKRLNPKSDFWALQRD